MFEGLRNLWGRPSTAEDDVAPDPATARTRESGGIGDQEEDRGTTTGTGPNEEFVGRIAGQDAGDDRESGAEVRARKES